MVESQYTWLVLLLRFLAPGAETHLAPHLAFGLLASFSAALIIVAAALLLTGAHWGNPAARFYLWSGGALVLICWILASRPGTSGNVAMPAYAFLAVAFGIALHALYTGFHGLPIARSQAGLTLLLFAACAQFVCHGRPNILLIHRLPCVLRNSSLRSGFTLFPAMSMSSPTPMSPLWLESLLILTAVPFTTRWPVPRTSRCCTKSIRRSNRKHWRPL